MHKILISLLVLSFTFAVLSLFMSCSQPPDNSEEVAIKTKNTSIQSSQELSVLLDNNTTQSPEEIEDFWTEERRRKAKPMPFPEAIIPEEDESDLPEKNLPIDTNPTGPPGPSQGGEQ